MTDKPIYRAVCQLCSKPFFTRDGLKTCPTCNRG